MRFMLMMLPQGYETAADSSELDPARVEEMMQFNADLQQAGVLLDLNGLHPPAMGARVSFATGEPLVTRGPFAEAAEVLGGYWIIQVDSLDDAIAWARRCPGSPQETIEIRQIQEMEDFTPAVQDVAAGYTDLLNSAYSHSV